MECIICFEEKEQIMLDCNHSLCVDCINKVDICPMCRFPIRKAHVVNPSHVIYIQSNDVVEPPFLARDYIHDNYLCVALSFFITCICFITAIFAFQSHS